MALTKLFPILVALLCAACDGPHEEAGEKADVAAGYTDTTSSLRQGPNERRGEKEDERDARARHGNSTTRPM
jgi:hypothetical protein